MQCRKKAHNARTLGVCFDDKLVKSMQRMTSLLSEGDSSVCNWYLLQSTYLINSLKVKASAKNVNLRYKHKLADIYAIHWCALHQWLSAAAHVTRQSSTASDITDLPLSTVALCSRFYSHMIQTWAVKAASYFARWILRSHICNIPLKSAAIVICKIYKVV